MRKALIATGVILVVLVVTNFQCYAEDLIYGCINKANGKLRVVSSPTYAKHRKLQSIGIKSVLKVHKVPSVSKDRRANKVHQAKHPGRKTIPTYTTMLAMSVLGRRVRDIPWT